MDKEKFEGQSPETPAHDAENLQGGIPSNFCQQSTTLLTGPFDLTMSPQSNRNILTIPPTILPHPNDYKTRKNSHKKNKLK